MCTIRNTPSLIEHCIEWARAKFTDLFVQPLSRLQKLAEDPAGLIADIQADLGNATGPGRTMVISRNLPALTCVTHSPPLCALFPFVPRAP